MGESDFFDPERPPFSLRCGRQHHRAASPSHFRNSIAAGSILLPVCGPKLSFRAAAHASRTSRAAPARPPALKKNTSARRRPQSTMNTLYIACLVAQVAAVPVR
jgi:hypothetical protein